MAAAQAPAPTTTSDGRLLPAAFGEAMRSEGRKGWSLLRNVITHQATYAPEETHVGVPGLASAGSLDFDIVGRWESRAPYETWTDRLFALPPGSQLHFTLFQRMVRFLWKEVHVVSSVQNPDFERVHTFNVSEALLNLAGMLKNSTSADSNYSFPPLSTAGRLCCIPIILTEYFLPHLVLFYFLAEDIASSLVNNRETYDGAWQLLELGLHQGDSLSRYLAMKAFAKAVPSITETLFAPIIKETIYKTLTDIMVADERKENRIKAIWLMGQLGFQLGKAFGNEKNIAQVRTNLGGRE
jgi:hypothetical protein